MNILVELSSHRYGEARHEKGRNMWIGNGRRGPAVLQVTQAIRRDL